METIVLETLLKPFRRTSTSAATAAQQREAARGLATEVQAKAAALAAAREEFGPALLKALAAGDEAGAATLRQRVADAERALGDAEALHEAAQQAVRRLDERQAADALQQRWAHAHSLVEQRNAAGVRAQAAADVLAGEMRAILKLEAEIAGAVPVPGWAPMGWAGGLLENLVQRYLAGIVPPCFAKSRGLSSLPEVQAVTLADAIRSSGEQMLAKAPETPAAKAAS